jgi:hypothetical protein
VKGLLPLIKVPLERIHLIALLREVECRGHGSAEDVANLIGRKWTERIYRTGEIDDFQRKTANWSDAELFRLIFGLVLQQEMVNDPSLSPPDDELLTPLVKLHGAGKLDVKKILQGVRKELEAKKPKPPKAESKKPGKKATTKTKGKKR